MSCPLRTTRSSSAWPCVRGICQTLTLACQLCSSAGPPTGKHEPVRLGAMLIRLVDAEVVDVRLLGRAVRVCTGEERLVDVDADVLLDRRALCHCTRVAARSGVVVRCGGWV